MNKKIKKRFIAGAVCPRCGARDKIMMYTQEGVQYRECVECDFNDEIRLQSPPSELKTRVNKPKGSYYNEAVSIQVISLKEDKE